MFMNSGTRGNKIGVMRSLSVSPLPPSLIKPVYGLQQAFFYRKRPPQHTRHIERGSRGERDIVPSTQDGGHAYVA